MTDNQHYTQRFQAVLTTLTPTQLAAVKQIEGPVLTIAGPGTGKTHIVAARIGYILSETDTQAHNILCLTYTDAGVTAMRQRLLSFIGPEAHRVHIHTFHSFCNAVIRDNAAYFGKRDLNPMSDLDKIEVVESILDALPHDHPLKHVINDTYFYLPHLNDLFRKMKMENWSSEMVNQQADRFLQEIPFRDDFLYKRKTGNYKKGDINQNKVDDATQKTDKLKAAAALFDVYETVLRQRGYYDYEDMILWVIRAFAQNEMLLRNYQERYLYFLADEFQDTNGSQYQLLKQLIQFWDNPNVFIVGDDDQSIYEFQGARLHNIIDFYTRYKADLHLISLKDNFRSSQAILNAAHELINYNLERIVRQLADKQISKQLTAQNPATAAISVQPKILAYPNKQHELAALLQQIKTWQSEGVPLHEIAVIYATHQQSELLIHLLEKEQIPYYVKKPVNVLHTPVVQQLIYLLEYLDGEQRNPFSKDDLLFKILYFECWQIEPLSIAALSDTQTTDKDSWRKRIATCNHLKINAVSHFLEDMLSQIHTHTLPIFVERVLNRSGLLTYVFEHNDTLQNVKSLYSFFQFVQDEYARNPSLHIRQLLEMIQKLGANRIAIPVQQVQLPETGLQLLTAHGSKGLEFQHVWMLDCVSSMWENQKGSNNTFSFPDTLTFSNETDKEESKRRLFYVALTRAKASATLSYSLSDSKNKSTDHTIFISELLNSNVATLQQSSVTTAILHHQQRLLLTEVAQPVINIYDNGYLDECIANFRLSISALNTYLRCPLSFYFEHILAAPTATRPAAAYGTAIHTALQLFFEEWRHPKNRPTMDASTLLRHFEKAIVYQKKHFDEKDYEHRKNIGNDILVRYYQQYAAQWQKPMEVERKINTEVRGVPITGIIDLLLYNGDGTAQIIDFKTKKLSPKSIAAPDEKQPFGGDFWRQLVFYKILFESYQKKQPFIPEGHIHWLVDTKGQIVASTIVLDAAAEAFVKELITTTYQKIQHKEFDKGCGEPTCNWCTFLLAHTSVDTFADTHTEDLDD